MKGNLLFKILFSVFALLSFCSEAQVNSPIKNRGDLAEYLWNKFSGQLQLTGNDSAAFYKARGDFFTATSKGIIDETNAAEFFEKTRADLSYISSIKAQTGQNSNTATIKGDNLPTFQGQGFCNPSCDNIGFQNSTLSAWSAWYGVNGSTQSKIIVNSLTGGACGSVTQAAGPDPNTGDDYHVSLMTSFGTDLVAGGLIPYTPPLGGISAMVGDGPMNGYGVGLLQQTYIVDPSNPILTIQYAVVLQNPGHPGYEQPWFRISLLDQNGDTIPGCAQYFVVAGPNNPGFKPVLYQPYGDTVYCRPWTTAFVPLNNYIGQCVTLIYEASDCALGGHFGYAYVAATCSKLDLVSSSDIYCTGQKSAVITGPPGSATYKWTTPDGCISGSNTQQILKVTCAGTFNLVTVSSAGAQCLDSFSVTLPPSSSGPPPVPCFHADTVCSGNPTHFNALCSNPNSGVTYYWDFYNNGNYEDSSGASPAWTYNVGGVYKVRLHLVSTGGCSTDTVMSIAVDSTDRTTFPTFSDSVINTTACNVCNGGVYLTMSLGTNSGVFYNSAFIVTNNFSDWRDSIYAFKVAATGTGPCDTSITTPLTSGVTKLGIRLGFMNCLCPGTYSFTIKSTKGTPPSKCNPGGLIGDTVQFTVGSVGANITSNVITAATSCGSNNGSATVTGLGGAVPYTYTWSGGLGTGATKSGLAAGTYSVSILDSNGCMGSAVVKILSSGQLPAIVTPYYISCYGANDGSIKVVPKGGLAPYIYNWSGNVSTTDSATGLAPGNYSITVTDAGGCSGTFTTAILQPTRLRDSLVSAVTSITCGGKGRATFGVSGGSQPYTFKWSDGVIWPTDTNLTAGITTITITDAGGCSVKDSVTVTATNGFSVNAGPDTILCANDSIQLHLSGMPNGSTISWLPATGLSCYNCSNPYAKPAVPTTYIVSAVDGSCSASDTIAVNVTPAIIAAVYPVDTTVCPDNFLKLHASGGTKYEWKPSSGLNDSIISDPLAYITKPITYTVTVSNAGCQDKATSAIDVYSAPPVPNITTFGDTLRCRTNPTYISYQWYFNDTLIAGAKDTFYVASKSGNYNVAVTDKNGCSIAVGINFVISGLEGFSFPSVIISPNPVQEELKINCNFLKGNISVLNVLGEIIQEEKINRDGITILNLIRLSPGIYFLQLNTEEGQIVKRFVKQ